MELKGKFIILQKSWKFLPVISSFMNFPEWRALVGNVSRHLSSWVHGTTGSHQTPGGALPPFFLSLYLFLPPSLPSFLLIICFKGMYTQIYSPGLSQVEARSRELHSDYSRGGELLETSSAVSPDASAGSWMGSQVGRTESRHSNMECGCPKHWLNLLCHITISFYRLSIPLIRSVLIFKNMLVDIRIYLGDWVLYNTLYIYLENSLFLKILCFIQ